MITRILSLAAIPFLILANVAFAQGTAQQTATGGIMSWEHINIFGLNAVFVIRILGEGYNALKGGTGLVGVFRSILYGAGVPPQIAKDYKPELTGKSDVPKPDDA